MRFASSIILVLAIGSIGLIGASVYLAQSAAGPRWPWWLAACRYAEIDDASLRDSIGAIIVAIGASSTCSDAYNERGSNYWSELDWSDAAREFALGLRISPQDLNLRNKHGLASTASGQFESAKNDFTIIFRAMPTDSDVLVNRGQAREALGDWEGAIADYTLAIHYDPTNFVALSFRGRAYAVLARYREGSVDLQSALNIAPNDLSTNLWLYLARSRGGEPDKDRLRQRVESLDLKRWPGPAIKYFLGQLSADMLEQIAFDDPDMEVRHQQCDAWFYLAEDALLHNEKAKAIRLLKLTTSRCNAVDFEWNAAESELKRLDN